MPSANKCLQCNGCCDIVMVLPRRFYRCFYCRIYYDIVDGKIVEVDIEKETCIPKTVLDEMYSKENSK